MQMGKFPFDMSKTQGPDYGTDSPKSIFRKCFPYRATDSKFLPSWKMRIGLFMFGVLQNGLSGGLIFGWASIDQSLLAEPQESGGAGLSLKETTTMFSWSTSISMVAALILGAVLDYSGPRIASMISCWSIAIGCIIFAFSKHFFGFALGTILFGFGGPGIGNCIIHLANLFPGNENLAMSTLSGSIAFSFSVFAIFDSLWSEYENLSFRDIFIGFAVILFFLGIGAISLFPDEPYEQLVDEDIADSDEDAPSETGDEFRPLLSERSIPEHEPAPQEDIARISAMELSGQHHDKHHHSAHAPPRISFIVEQPFNSYLRDKQRMVQRTNSYVASSKSLARGGPAVSLKDQPFVNQLTSASYLRAFFVFLVSTFVTNFYVGTLSTELKDRQDFTAETRHELSRWFTIIMSMGIVASLLVGSLIDRIGLEFCTAMTLMFGQLQMILVLFGSGSETMMILSFVAYTMFRSFLYPVFIGSLTSRLGFKYFGILLGLGFALSGVVQLLFPVLVHFVQGDCHLLEDARVEEALGGAPECDHGKWHVTEVVQFFLLGAMHIVPILDHLDTVARERQIQLLLLSPSPRKTMYRYGSGSENSDS